jgi:hypothetical protein
MRSDIAAAIAAMIRFVDIGVGVG